MRSKAFLIVLLAAPWGWPAAAQDAPTALHRAERAYAGITSLTADFVQTIVNPMLGGPESSRGILYLVPPNRFAMRFVEPQGDRIVADGKWLWSYAPSSVPDQVIKQPIPASGATTPNLMAEFVERPLERYDATYLGLDSVAGELVDVVRLDPQAADAPFRDAVIAVGRNDGLLRRIAFREESGQRRTLVLERIRTNVSLPDGELRFDVPRGTRVVTP